MGLILDIRQIGVLNLVGEERTISGPDGCCCWGVDIQLVDVQRAGG